MTAISHHRAAPIEARLPERGACAGAVLKLFAEGGFR
jgi:hypothetical protein